MKRALAAAFVLGCAHEPASTVVEIPPAELPAPPNATAATLPPIESSPRGECAPPPSLAGCAEIARVRVGAFAMSSPTCSIDARVREGEVGSLVRCPSGAVVRFAAVTFAGSLAGDTVSTCAKTKFPYSGCTWESTQRIDGAGRALELTYSERVIAGHDCAGNPCTARAPLEVVGP